MAATFPHWYCTTLPASFIGSRSATPVADIGPASA
jgi:hypothetical protein